MATRYTANQEEIRSWIEEHSGVPVFVKGVEENGGESPDMLHVAFGPLAPDMEELSWEEFFERLENEQLALEYEDGVEKEQTPDFTFVDRDRAREELYPEEELPDTGDIEVLQQNTIPDHDGE